jgi:hypothetical protein
LAVVLALVLAGCGGGGGGRWRLGWWSGDADTHVVRTADPDGHAGSLLAAVGPCGDLLPCCSGFCISSQCTP